MSAPIRNEDALGDPLLYAPRWARQSPRVEPELSTFADAPSTVPEHAPAPKSAIADLDAHHVPICKRGKTGGGGMIIRFTRQGESDSLWEWLRPQTSTA